MYSIPADQIAKFPPPNYVDPETRGDALTIVNAIFLAVATIVIVLRLYTRLFVRKWFGIDDVCICVAYAASVGFNAITFLGISKFQWNRHSWDVSPDLIPSSAKLGFAGVLVYVLTSMFIAYSLLAFYYRLIAESGVHWFRWTLHIVLGLNIAFWTAVFIGEIFICTPVSFYWEVTGPPGAHCMDEGPLTLTSGVIKTILDAIITTLPIPLVLRTEMRRRQRFMVAGLFALGYVVTGAGIARVYYTYKAFFTNGDITWWQYPTFVTSTIENNIAIVCACAPTIRPLFPHWFGPESRFRGWLTSNTHSSRRDTAPSTTAVDPKRSSNISQYGSRIRSFAMPRATQAEDDTDDMELVMTKNADHGGGTTITTERSESDTGLEFGGLEQPEKKRESMVNARLTKTKSTYSVASTATQLNHFDPRLDFDLEDQQYTGR